MAQSVTIIPNALPSYLQGHKDTLIAAINAAAGGGIKADGFPHISVGGSKFFIADGNERVLITDPQRPDLPAMELEVVVVGANPHISKTYYAHDYVEGSDAQPDCSSDDSVQPDSHITVARAASCTTCPQNVWGSKIGETIGNEIKACSDSKRLVVVPAGNLTFKALALSVTSSSLKEWGQYVNNLSARNIPLPTVVTALTFDPKENYPKLLFSFRRLLTAEEYQCITARVNSDEVKQIASPRRQSVAPVLAAPAQNPVEQAAAQTVAELAAKKATENVAKPGIAEAPESFRRKPVLDIPMRSEAPVPPIPPGVTPEEWAAILIVRQATTPAASIPAPSPRRW